MAANDSPCNMGVWMVVHLAALSLVSPSDPHHGAVQGGGANPRNKVFATRYLPKLNFFRK